VHRPIHRSIGALALASAVLLAGCIGTESGCFALVAEIEATLSADSLAPSNLEVCRGDQVTLTVTPEVDGVLHVHGYDDELPAVTVATGKEIELGFTATRSGQFPIELHTDENTAGVSVGLLTVHEP
jgi:hypothetical protein